MKAATFSAASKLYFLDVHYRKGEIKCTHDISWEGYWEDEGGGGHNKIILVIMPERKSFVV